VSPSTSIAAHFDFPRSSAGFSASSSSSDFGDEVWKKGIDSAGVVREVIFKQLQGALTESECVVDFRLGASKQSCRRQSSTTTTEQRRKSLRAVGSVTGTVLDTKGDVLPEEKDAKPMNGSA